MLTPRDLPTLVAFIFCLVLLFATLYFKFDRDNAYKTIERIKKAHDPPPKEPTSQTGSCLVILIYAIIAGVLCGNYLIWILFEFMRLLSI